MLSERQRMILSAIVEDYIRSAEPIGSRSISKRDDVSYSPATIRNEMSDLEEMGYLEQPHTSAGRIPSHKGYRYYVDHLVREGNLSSHELDVVKMFFAGKVQEMESVIQHVAGVLSGLTNYTSIVLGPEVFSSTLKHLQIIPINIHTAVAIMITNTGHVENKTVTIPEGMSFSDIEKVVNVLNDKLKNIPLIEFKSKLYSEVSSELAKVTAGYTEWLSMIEGVLQNDETNRIYVSGATNMLMQPEFKDVDKVKTILDLFEETRILLQVVAPSQSGIQIKIGAENSVEAMNDCSLITASYSIGDQMLGTIGILGPTRMEYAKVIRLLDHISKNMALELTKWYEHL